MRKENIDYGEYYKRFYELWEKSMSEAIEMWSKNPFLKREGNEMKSMDFDSSTYYKNFYEVWEKTTSEALEKWVNSPIFASNIGRVIEKSSEFKKYFDQVFERSLKNMHLPSKTDIDRILNSINNIEAKINDLTDKVDLLLLSRKTTSKK